MVVLPRWHCKVERGVRYSFSGLEILLGEGGDVELGARTSKHILLLAFDPLSLLPYLSFNCAKHHSSFISFILLVLCLAYIHIAYSSYMLGLLVCVPHLYLTTRASYSTSTYI